MRVRRGGHDHRVDVGILQDLGGIGGDGHIAEEFLCGLKATGAGIAHPHDVTAFHQAEVAHVVGTPLAKSKDTDTHTARSWIYRVAAAFLGCRVEFEIGGESRLPGDPREGTGSRTDPGLPRRERRTEFGGTQPVDQDGITRGGVGLTAPKVAAETGETEAVELAIILLLLPALDGGEGGACR